jgi:hypothetical protein
VSNPERLKLLQQGVEVWNAWRLKELSICPDLDGANLSGADLREANLDGAALRGANLSGADLRGLTSARRTSAGRTSPW